MKKIVSLLCVVAMMFTFFAFSANAAGNSLDFVSRTIDGGVEIDVVFETTYANIYSAQFYIDMTAALAAGANVTISSKPNSAVSAILQSKYVPNKKYVSVTYMDASGMSGLKSGTLATITITGVTSDFALALATNKLSTVSNGADAVTDSFTMNFPTITLAPAGPNWNKIDATVEEFESDADVEAGYAYGVNYTCAGAAAMIFAAGADEARQYSNEIAVDGATGAVNVGFVSAKALENVGVLFRDADKANIWYSLDVDKH